MLVKCLKNVLFCGFTKRFYALKKGFSLSPSAVGINSINNAMDRALTKVAVGNRCNLCVFRVVIPANRLRVNQL